MLGQDSAISVPKFAFVTSVISCPQPTLKDNQCKVLSWSCLLKYRRTRTSRSARCGKPSGATPALAAGLLCFVLVSFLGAAPAGAQAPETDKPVPILTGSFGSFSFVTGGQNLIDSQINPILLLPLGNHWLIESRAEFEGQFQRPTGGGPYAGPVSKNLDYLQVDYIANPYVTVTLGRFLTPFGIFNERLYPVWIRSLQQDPLILPLAAESSDGMMLRGGFAASAKANLNYAVYVSGISTGHNNLQSDRSTGGRMGFFFPGPRIEVGASWQKLLQDSRTNAFGFHFAWQAANLPLSVHSEYARTNQGSGYWIDGAYRLSRVPFWQRAMRRTEFAGRMEQFFNGSISPDDAEALGLPGANTREGEVGLNYYLHDGLRVVGSYGRQFSSAGNVNLWTFGITYRFLIPLGRVGTQGAVAQAAPVQGVAAQ